MHRTSSRYFVRCRGIGRPTLLWSVVAIGAVGVIAFWFWPTGNPVPPTALDPTGTRLQGHIPTSPVPLSWVQTGVVRSLSGPPAGRATRFIVCVYSSATAGHDCFSGASTLLRESHDAATIPHADAPLGGGFSSLLGQKFNPRYRYTLSVSLPQGALDVPLSWTVGACKTADNATCNFAPAGTLELTARDLHINRVNPTVHTNDIDFVDDIVNEGETQNEPYALETRIWQVIMLPRPPSAQTDVNAAGVDATDIAVTRGGEEYPVADYRNGTRPASEVMGIRKPSMLRVSWSRTVPNVPAPGVALPTEVDPCDASPCKLTVPSQSRPAIFAAWARVGQPAVKWELDAADNEARRNDITAY